MSTSKALYLVGDEVKTANGIQSISIMLEKTGNDSHITTRSGSRMILIY